MKGLKESRNFARYASNLTARMGIEEINKKPAHSKRASVQISDISMGGLSFVSPLDLPVRNDVILRLETLSYGAILGHIVWKKKDQGGFKYGVKITSSEPKLFKILGNYVFAENAFIESTQQNAVRMY